MKKAVIIFSLIGLIGYVGFLNISNSISFNEEKLQISYYREKEEALLKFIDEHFLGIEGEVFTNIKPFSSDMDTLSESVGLLMNYCILRNRKDTYDIEVGILSSKLLTQDNFIRWKLGKDAVNCNAAIDDFRIIRALLEGYEKWNNKSYLNLAGFIQEKMYSFQTKEYSLYEFYDWKSNRVKETIPLCYLDLYTMNKMGIFNKQWESVADKGLATIIGGRVGDLNPFHKKYYNYNSNTYSLDEEYTHGKGICMIYELYTILNLTEYNGNTEYFTKWLKAEIENQNGKLFAWYDPYTLKPAQKMENPAVYALAAVYSKQVGENELYRVLLGKMLQYMVTNEKSPYYGGIGNEFIGEFYSFDNLTALWALAMNEN